MIPASTVIQNGVLQHMVGNTKPYFSSGGMGLGLIPRIIRRMDTGAHVVDFGNSNDTQVQLQPGSYIVTGYYAASLHAQNELVARIDDQCSYSHITVRPQTVGLPPNREVTWIIDVWGTEPATIDATITLASMTFFAIPRTTAHRETKVDGLRNYSNGDYT